MAGFGEVEVKTDKDGNPVEQIVIGCVRPVDGGDYYGDVMARGLLRGVRLPASGDITLTRTKGEWDEDIFEVTIRGKTIGFVEKVESKKHGTWWRGEGTGDFAGVVLKPFYLKSPEEGGSGKLYRDGYRLLIRAQWPQGQQPPAGAKSEPFPSVQMIPERQEEEFPF